MRYTGPKAKRCRALGINLFGNDKFDKCVGANPPGQHGAARKKRSDYADHLIEKQKIKWSYGVTERQFRKLYEEATRSRAVTGTVLLQLLERRLDNVLFRSGLFMSKDQARQLVSHGHVLLNGDKMSIASARLKVGDVISFRQRSRNSVRKLIREHGLPPANWVSVNKEQLAITVTSIPERDDMDQTFKESLVAEFYSRC